jgi:hypothetical protein
MALHSRDVQKILRAGFTIIREDEWNLKINRKTADQQEWHTWEKGFKSKAELRRRMDSFLNSFEKIIED